MDFRRENDLYVPSSAVDHPSAERILVAVAEPSGEDQNQVAFRLGDLVCYLTPAVAHKLADWVHEVANEAAKNEKKRPD